MPKFYISRTETYRACVEARSLSHAEEIIQSGEIDWSGQEHINGMESVVGEAPHDAEVTAGESE